MTGVPTRELTGEDQAYRMIREISGIDVLIAGHTHVRSCGTAFDTVYAEPGQYGDCLACIDIYTDTGVIDARIIPNDTPADSSVLELVKAEEAECQEWLDTPIGRTGMDLTIHDQFEARFHKSQVVTLFNRIMLEASGASTAAACKIVREMLLAICH